MTLEEIIKTWEPVILSTISFSNYLDTSLNTGIKTPKTIKNDINIFTSMVSAISTVNKQIFMAFAEKVSSE